VAAAEAEATYSAPKPTEATYSAPECGALTGTGKRSEYAKATAKAAPERAGIQRRIRRRWM
jgi:hypothetical protein